MDSAFIEWVLGQTGIAGLAAVSLWMLNKANQDALRREKESGDQHRADKTLLIQALSDTAKAMAGLEDAIRSVIRGRNPHGS